MVLRFAWLAMLALAACGPQRDDSGNGTGTGSLLAPKEANPPAPPPPAPPPPAPPRPAPHPSPLEEPKSQIDPRSAEAAGQVVQRYGALIEQGRWTASRDLWSSAGAAKAFERNFRRYADVHIEIGDLGNLGAAAGSIYVTEPAIFYGNKIGGGNYRRAAVITLRRVNDVPGSTEVQRRWHIERIDWTGD